MNIIVPLLMWFIETRGQILYYIKMRLDQLDANSKGGKGCNEAEHNQ